LAGSRRRSSVAQLNYNREGFWSSLGHLYGGYPVQISPYADWEARLPPGRENREQRFDILTSQTNPFEVIWWGDETEAGVQRQINRYIKIAGDPPFHLRIRPGTELAGWANAFYVINGRSRCRPFTWTESADGILPHCRPRDRRSGYFNLYIAVLAWFARSRPQPQTGHPEQLPRRMLDLFRVSVVRCFAVSG
jgi:hypothetical protein